jgi:hypothetical protein
MYHDLDILVPEDAFADTIDALEASGFHLVDRNWTLIRRERRGQLHVALRLGTLADVHWHLINRERVRRSLTLPMPEIFERARAVSLFGLELRTLDPVDTLTHLCLHAALSGGDRLIWLKDVERAIATEGPDWQQVVDRACGWGASPLVGLVLARTSWRLGAPVPDDVIRELLAGPRWLVSRVLDRLWPPERSSGRATPSVVWAQSVRPTWRGTARAMLQRASRRALRAGPSPGSAPPREDPASVLFTSGDAGDRDVFIRDVGERPPGRSQDPSSPERPA